ncbi:MAG: cobalamin biosynthesis protein CbiX [Burkholderiales bacterium PBB1]|nr:MAG: cobalamin biosynthesis protein CbiX [Burkholderiales bacterium PBB1]
MSTAPTGLLLFAHGARDPNWALPFEAVLSRVREQAPEIAVSLSFLEFMAPTLLEAGDTLAAAGCTQVAIVPLFLGTGGHVRKDLPLLIEALRSAHPQVTWTLRSSIGEAPGVIEAMATAALRPTDTVNRP